MRISGILLLILFFYGCSKEQLKAPDAYFFKINKVSVVVSTPSVQGTTSHKITDLFLYVNGNFRGAYPSGKTLPIASWGGTKILIYPGIKNNGISTTRIPYEFLSPIQIDTSLNNGDVVNRDLNFSYKPNAVFHWNEDFEGFGTITGITMKMSGNADTSFSVVSNDPNVFEGTKCILMSGFSGTSVDQIESNSQFTLPLSGAVVYLELNYKCNQDFEVGVVAGTEYRSVEIIPAKDYWNKIYIQLSSAISVQPNYSKYGIYFKAINEVSAPQIFLDNIKVISF